ncbi:hypothetical protein RB653_003857 [Dictyostelium firmibasis]|uniref:Potassium transport protein n=1 Tax=Dictyostelium firmibasis TaxID=79012 RepID=A0AAN7YRW9_9MYCE
MKIRILKKYIKIKLKQLLNKIITLIDRNYFFRFHLIYFVIIGFVGSVIIKLIEFEVPFIDCLYIAYSALTTTGLVTVDISNWSKFTLFILILLVQLGSTVLLTLPIVLLRRFFIRSVYSNSSLISAANSSPDLISTIIHSHIPHQDFRNDNENGDDDDIDFDEDDDVDADNLDNKNKEIFDNQENSHDNNYSDNIEIGGILKMDSPLDHDFQDDNAPHHYIIPKIEKKDRKSKKLGSSSSSSTKQTIQQQQEEDTTITSISSPNNRNVITTNNNNNNNTSGSPKETNIDMIPLDLLQDTQQQQQQQQQPQQQPQQPQQLPSPLNSNSYEDNMEYRSLGKLLVIIPCYILTIYILGFISIGAYIAGSESTKSIMKANGVNGWWWSLFHTFSAFNNAGLALFSDSLIQINEKYFLLIVISILIFLGNTLFPVFLRIILLIISKFTKDPEPYKNLLENPRSIFTHLFPYKETAQLFIIWIIFNISQIALMALLDVNDKAFTNMNKSAMLLNYYFSSISTRTCGFNSVDLNLLSESVLLLFVGLMFVSSYPFIISLRRSAVNNKYSNQSREVMKDILIRDIFVPYICILLIAIFENHLLENGVITVFQILFEAISAFGNVGLSISITLSTYSKLVYIALMLAGKHRQLPESVDESVNPAHLKKNAVIAKIITRYKRRKL